MMIAGFDVFGFFMEYFGNLSYRFYLFLFDVHGYHSECYIYRSWIVSWYITINFGINLREIIGDLMGYF